MTKLETALDLFSRRFNCAQALLGAYGPDEGLDETRSLMLAAPFGGGIGRLGLTCGAVAGAIMVLGLHYGADAARDPAARSAMYDRVRDYVERFKARNGSIACRELLGCDISTPQGRQEAQDRQTHVNVCPRFIRDAAEILEEALARG